MDQFLFMACKKKELKNKQTKQKQNKTSCDWNV